MEDLDQAFQVVRRMDFLPLGMRPMAGADMPLSIGHGQTNSQPSTVRMMLEWLNVRPGNKVLDVGSGSGWTTALLAYLVGPAGFVHAVERIRALVSMGRNNCVKAGVQNASFHAAGGTMGLPEFAPYHRILVSAAAKELPPSLLAQLAPGGKLVIPVIGTIMEITKSADDSYETAEHPGFVFVPLVGN